MVRSATNRQNGFAPSSRAISAIAAADVSVDATRHRLWKHRRRFNPEQHVYFTGFGFAGAGVFAIAWRGALTASSAPGVGFGLARQLPARSCAASPGPQGDGGAEVTMAIFDLCSVSADLPFTATVGIRETARIMDASAAAPSMTNFFFISASSLIDQPMEINALAVDFTPRPA